MYRTNSESTVTLDRTCHNCACRFRCIGQGLSDSSLAKLVTCGQVAKPAAKSQTLFRAGDKPNRIFCVKTGSVKTYRLTTSGEQQVTGFYFPGMVFGMADLSQGQRDEYAETLENASLCAFSLTEAKQVLSQDTQLLGNLLQQISNHMRTQNTLTSHVEAEARLRYYLGHIQESLSRPGLEIKGFTLPMTNKDLANFLALRPETLSRLFKNMKQQGELILSGRQVALQQSAPIAA